MIRYFVFGAAFLLFSSSLSIAGGYQVSLHGHRQIGMGLIGTSLHMDASTMFFNPGGLAMMPQQVSILGGVSGIFANTAFRMEQPSVYQAQTDNPPGTPFYFYAAAMVTDRLAAGVAVNTPYGNSLSWEEGWAGRFLIQDISLRAITIQPTLSYRISDMLSVGAGFIYTLGSVGMTQALPVTGPDGEGRVNIEGSTFNYGFNAGIQFSHPGGLKAGLSYRSQIDMELENADALFSVPSSLTGNFPAENSVAVTLPLPANLDFGLSYQFTRDFMAGISLNYVFWDAYKELYFDFETNTPALDDSRNPRNYSNTLIARIGGEYRVNQDLFLRAGAYFDPSPVHEDYFSPETPSLDNLAFSGGLTYMPTSNLSIDASLLFVMGLEKEATYSPENFGGTYSTRVLIPGIGISYRL